MGFVLECEEFTEECWPEDDEMKWLNFLKEVEMGKFLSGFVLPILLLTGNHQSCLLTFCWMIFSSSLF